MFRTLAAIGTATMLLCPGLVQAAPRDSTTVTATDPALATVLGSLPEYPGEDTFILVSIRHRRVWFVTGGDVRFTARVAVGRHTMNDPAAPAAGRFATPRGRFVVQRRDSMPLWAPPDWHFAEQSKKTGHSLRSLPRGDTLHARDGSRYYVAGGTVVRIREGGRITPVSVAPGSELVVDGAIIVPPLGTTLRQYPRVLGTRRLYLGNGYGLHGTTDPSSIGSRATHGCIRMTNHDIETLYDLAPVGTPVYVQ